MPAVFVHGVPETHIIWDPIRSHLSGKDVVAVDLPGFGAPLPAGFDATKEAYAAWLIAEIEKSASRLTSSGTTGDRCSPCASPPRGPAYPHLDRRLRRHPSRLRLAQHGAYVADA